MIVAIVLAVVLCIAVIAVWVQLAIYLLRFDPYEYERKRQRRQLTELTCDRCDLPFQAGSFYTCAGCLDSRDTVGIALNKALREKVHA